MKIMIWEHVGRLVATNVFSEPVPFHAIVVDVSEEDFREYQDTMDRVQKEQDWLFELMQEQAKGKV